MAFLTHIRSPIIKQLMQLVRLLSMAQNDLADKINPSGLVIKLLSFTVTQYLDSCLLCFEKQWIY